MRQPVKLSNLQLNLPLVPTEPAAALPGDRQKDLAWALVELLINAARESGKQQAIGGEDESQTQL